MVQVEIPDKLYFKIGEVSKLLTLKPYVLRYWETEFKDIAPVKSKTGQRLYRRREVEKLKRIRELLYRERYTIDGARKKLREEFRDDAPDNQLGLGLKNDPATEEKWAKVREASSDLKILVREMEMALKEW